MGWNSWDCFGPTVTEDEVKANADYMAAYLKEYGWQYIVVDIRWYVENDKAHDYNQKDAIIVMDEYGRLMPAVNRFPSAAGGKGFKPLADYVHDKGLKLGIHLMRGIPKLAVEKNTPVWGSNVSAKDIFKTKLMIITIPYNISIIIPRLACSCLVRRPACACFMRWVSRTLHTFWITRINRVMTPLLRFTCKTPDTAAAAQAGICNNSLSVSNCACESKTFDTTQLKKRR